MKKIILALTAIIIGISFSSVNACLFGNTLETMARINTLQTGPEIILNKKTVLTKTQKSQIVNALKKESKNIKTIENAFNYTDENVFYVRTVFDTLSYNTYTMYLYYAGDTLCGFIFKENTLNQVATIGDASIYNCTVRFNKQYSLPWFYSKSN